MSLLTNNTHALSLDQAEKLALAHSVELTLLKTHQHSFLQEAIAKSQWEDPTLIAGIMNLPSDTFKLNQEAMTQLKVGIKQELPRGKRLFYIKKIYNTKADNINALINLKKLDILKTVRTLWSELYYWHQIRIILLKEKSNFKQLARVLEALYENNKAQQKDVFNARLQLSKVEGKIMSTQRSYQAVSYSLERWLGIDKFKKYSATLLPKFQRLPKLDRLKKRLERHPLLLIDENDIKIKQLNKQLKKEDFKPSLGIGVDYAKRESALNGQKRSDLVSLGVSIKLPLYMRNKQQKNYELSLNALKLAYYQKQLDEKNLKEKLNRVYSEFVGSGDELDIYRRKIIPQAKRYAKSTLIAYQNNQTDYITLSNSYLELYKLEQQQEILNFMHAKQKITLLYLKG